MLNSWFQTFFYASPPKKQVIVATVKLKPATATSPVTHKATSQPTPKTKEESKKTVETPKSEKKPKVVDKKTTAKGENKKSETKASKPTFNFSQVQHALQNLNAIQPASFNPSEDVEGEDIADESLRVAAYIRSWLKLPEFGKVTVRIKFNPEGKIVSLETINSESDRNQKYIEQNLCLLTLPVAKNKTSRQSEKRLVLVLSNE